MRFKKVWKRNLFFRNVNDEMETGGFVNGYSGLGDTSYFEFENFYRYKNTHEAIDTVYGSLYTGGNNKWFFQKEMNQAVIDMMEKYSFFSG